MSIAIGNWSIVESDKLYRGAQPADEQFRALAEAGIRTVIDLRLDGEHKEFEASIGKA